MTTTRWSPLPPRSMPRSRANRRRAAPLPCASRQSTSLPLAMSPRRDRLSRQRSRRRAPRTPRLRRPARRRSPRLRVPRPSHRRRCRRPRPPRALKHPRQWRLQPRRCRALRELPSAHHEGRRQVSQAASPRLHLPCSPARPRQHHLLPRSRRRGRRIASHRCLRSRSARRRPRRLLRRSPQHLTHPSRRRLRPLLRHSQRRCRPPRRNRRRPRSARRAYRRRPR
jgi:hypothetical protein